MKKMLMCPVLLMIMISCVGSTQSDTDAPTTDYWNDFSATGDYIKMGVDSSGYLADSSLGYGLQYPIGSEHLAVAWWGEGYFVGYYDSGGTLHTGSAYASFGPTGLTFVSETDMSTASEFRVVDVAKTTDNRVQLTHDFLLPKSEKFVILTVTLKNIGNDTITGLKYKRIADWDMDNTASGDSFDYLGDEGYPIIMAWDTHYAGFATASNTPADLHDSFWDSYNVYTTSINLADPDGVEIDGAGVFIFEEDTLDPGESVTYKMYYILGDSKSDILNGYSAAESYGMPPAPEFATGAIAVAILLTTPAFAYLIVRKRGV